MTISRRKESAPKFTLLSAACITFASSSAWAFVSPPGLPSNSRHTQCNVFKNPFVADGGSAGIATSDAPPIPVTNTNNPLIKLANDYIYNKSGFFSDYDESVFADDFVFRGPYIGPLNKKDYLSTMDTFKIYKALPDINPNAWGFSIDPKNPNRVWYFVRNTGTFNGEPIGLGNGLDFKPNNAVLDGCPETHSILFDEDRKVKLLTVGYVADRFEGNTRGDGVSITSTAHSLM